MPRPWEYTPMRRRMMQVVLCALLALTVVMAWGVGRTRSRTLAVNLRERKDYSFPFLSLSIQFPQDWIVITRNTASHCTVAAEEKKQSDETGRGRTILVSETSLSEDQQAIKPEEFAASKPDASEHQVVRGPLDFLGTTGVFVEVPGLVERDEDGRIRKSDAELYACAVLPASHVAVTVKLLGPSVFTPSDFDLVRSVALSLKPISTAPRPAPNAGDDEANTISVNIKGTDGTYKAVREAGGLWVCEITSPTGSGKARLDLHGEKWPGRIVLRFMGFRDLGELSVEHDTMRLETSLDARQPELSRLSPDGQASQMPYEAAYATRIARKKGYIEVTLPQAVFRENQWVKIRWLKETI